MFSRRRVAALVLTVFAAVTVGIRLDGALAAGPGAGTVTAQSTPMKLVAGYWMLSSDGHVYAFGAATKFGESVGALPGRVDLVSTPTGAGYWVLTETGGIFAFGDAKYHGAPAPLAGGDRFVSLASTPDGGGYWVFSAMGRSFPFGNARPSAT